MQQKLHHRQRVNSGCNVIQNDSGTFGKALQLPHRGRLHDIKGTKKYKTGEKSFPREGRGNEGDQLSSDFVDYHKLRIFYARIAGDLRRGWNADHRDQHCQRDGHRDSQHGRQGISGGGPQSYRCR